MVLSNPKLWLRTKAYELDNIQAQFPFSKRLARENGWNFAFAERAFFRQMDALVAAEGKGGGNRRTCYRQSADGKGRS